MGVSDDDDTPFQKNNKQTKGQSARKEDDGVATEAKIARHGSIDPSAMTKQPTKRYGAKGRAPAADTTASLELATDSSPPAVQDESMAVKQRIKAQSSSSSNSVARKRINAGAYKNSLRSEKELAMAPQGSLGGSSRGGSSSTRRSLRSSEKELAMAPPWDTSRSSDKSQQARSSSSIRGSASNSDSRLSSEKQLALAAPEHTTVDYSLGIQDRDAILSSTEEDAMKKPKSKPLKPGAHSVVGPGGSRLVPHEEDLLLEDDHMLKDDDKNPAVPDPYDPANSSRLNAAVGAVAVAGIGGQEQDNGDDGVVLADLVDEEAIAEEILRNRSQEIRNQIMGEAVVATNVEKDEGTARRNRVSVMLCCVALLVIVGVVLGITLSRDKGGDGTPTPTDMPSETPTSAPSLSEFEELVQLLSTVNNREVLLNETTPQYRALQWLHVEDLYDSKNDPVVLLNRYVLAVLYFSTNGSSWLDQLGFLSNTTECEWPPLVAGETEVLNGVRCNDQGELVRIRLDFNNLEGTLPEELSSRTALEVLSAATNSLYGALPPSFGDLARLEFLDMAENGLSGPLPDSFGRLTNLDQLALFDNKLTGTIPGGVPQIGSLESLRLHENMFVGTIPEFVIRSGLSRLMLRDNNLTGTIPMSIYTLQALTRLTLSDNNLNGTISPEILDLQRLTSLGLNENGLTGTIPVELGALAELTYLGLGSNLINGTIPEELGDLLQLYRLIIANNDLSGTIPSSLGRLTELFTLNVEGNRLTGEVPSELGQLEVLRGGGINISSNSLTGSVSEIFCKNNSVTPSLTADCEEVECSCCTECCDDATGECTVELPQICESIAFSLEDCPDCQDVFGTDCNCNEAGNLVSCANLGCQSCNFDETICFEMYDFGYTLPPSGLDNMWRCNMRYTAGPYGNLSYSIDLLNGECEIGLDGTKCSSCVVNRCADGFDGPRMDCTNVHEGAILDMCDLSVGNAGSSWLPLTELFTECTPCFVF